MSPRAAESTRFRSSLLRITLAAEECQAYWQRVDLTVPLHERLPRAFEERWFGAKSEHWVQRLLADLSDRFDAFPQALCVLRGWPGMGAATRRLVCHWHLQLADPLYRGFTGKHLAALREGFPGGALTRDAVARWVAAQAEGRWGLATRLKFASKLLSTAHEAGLLDRSRAPRAPALPPVPDEALEYLLHLLREVEIRGTLLDNPYLASVGLTGPFLERRLGLLPGLGYRRQGDLVDLDWQAPSLAEWGAKLRREEAAWSR